MNNKNFFENYFKSMNLHTREVNINHLDLCIEMIQNCKETNNKVILVGNGGSASIASHLAIDFTKAANIRSISFNEASLITCFANDYGYKNWVSKAIEFYAKKGDVVILISSSGSSENIIEGAKKAREMGTKDHNIFRFFKFKYSQISWGYQSLG